MAVSILCFGEILWDILPTGALPGGAPMNVAYHLKKLGHEPQLLTRIGSDPRGSRLLELLREQGIGTEGVQTDAVVPTGTVDAVQGHGFEMSYHFADPSAWDLIEYPDGLRPVDYLIFGSLAVRKEISRTTLFKLIEQAATKVLDINLRAPFYNEQLIEDLLYKADIVKMNDAELAEIGNWFADYDDDEPRMTLIQEWFSVKTIIVTRGSRGAIVNHEGKFYEHPGYPVEVADTIGSGDSFLAAFLSGLIAGKTIPEILNFACSLGAFVTSKKGAWPDYQLSDITIRD